MKVSKLMVLASAVAIIGRLSRTANFETTGPEYDAIMAEYAWARGVLSIEISSALQTL